MEKLELQAALKTASNSSVHKSSHDAQENPNKESNHLNEVVLVLFSNIVPYTLRLIEF